MRRNRTKAADIVSAKQQDPGSITSGILLFYNTPPVVPGEYLLPVNFWLVFGVQFEFPDFMLQVLCLRGQFFTGSRAFFGGCGVHLYNEGDLRQSLRDLLDGDGLLGRSIFNLFNRLADKLSLFRCFLKGACRFQSQRFALRNGR